MTPDQWVALVAGIGGGALRVGTPFLFVSLGECLTEKSGRINLGLEGVLVLSAMAAFGAAYLSGSPWMGVLAGAVAGAQPPQPCDRRADRHPGGGRSCDRVPTRGTERSAVRAAHE